VIAYRDCIDAFGVGGTIANAPVIDFAMDIVEIEGEPKAKRGKRCAIKQVYSKSDGGHVVLPAREKAPEGAVPLLERYIENGKVVQDSWMQDARKRAAAMVAQVKIA